MQPSAIPSPARVGAIGALMNRVRQPRTLVVLGLNAKMGTAARVSGLGFRAWCFSLSFSLPHTQSLTLTLTLPIYLVRCPYLSRSLRFCFPRRPANAGSPTTVQWFRGGLVGPEVAALSPEAGPGVRDGFATKIAFESGLDFRSERAFAARARWSFFFITLQPRVE